MLEAHLLLLPSMGYSLSILKQSEAQMLWEQGLRGLWNGRGRAVQRRVPFSRQGIPVTQPDLLGGFFLKPNTNQPMGLLGVGTLRGIKGTISLCF